MSGLFESMASLVNILFKNVFWYITRKRSEQGILEYTWFLHFVPDKYKTQEMYKRNVGVDPRLLLFGPNKYKTREMCERVVDVQQWMLLCVPDNLKTLRMCDKVVE